MVRESVESVRALSRGILVPSVDIWYRRCTLYVTCAIAGSSYAVRWVVSRVNDCSPAHIAIYCTRRRSRCSVGTRCLSLHSGQVIIYSSLIHHIGSKQLYNTIKHKVTKSIDRLSSDRRSIKYHKSTRAIEKVWTRDYWQSHILWEIS